MEKQHTTQQNMSI